MLQDPEQFFSDESNHAAGVAGQWEAFERADNPTVEYNFDELQNEHPPMTALLTFLTVSTFLAGFAIADTAASPSKSGKPGTTATNSAPPT